MTSAPQTDLQQAQGLQRTGIVKGLRVGSLLLESCIVMAPLAGISDLAFRILARRHGAAMVTSEMVSAHGLIQGQKKTFSYMRTLDEEAPLAVQIFGADPAVMEEAARIAVGSGATVLDINAGCPVRKVVRTGAGGALLKEPALFERILARIRRCCPVPLTVKMRTGWSHRSREVLDLARIAEGCGVDAVTVHGRSVSQGFCGNADWDIIGEVKACLHIPVIGNGDITEPIHAIAMMEKTGCDGVMIGRAAIGNPWIFGQVRALGAGLAATAPGLDERREAILTHFELLSKLEGGTRAARRMRGLLLWYTKSLPFSSRFRGAITSITDTSSLMDALDLFLDKLTAAGAAH
ncbi:tRNA-dihydrouridine synthase [uncultured Desulfatiglans sp.]|nr:tRNA-dihydrouridine synthase [uncultured Desulfatiglans sp.]